jgi:hypothetical protein
MVKGQLLPPQLSINRFYHLLRFVLHFDDVLGHGSLHKLFSKNPVGFANFNNYFYSIFKISVDGFESKFFTLIKNKYKFLFILNLENFIFLIAILLLFASYFES